VIPQKNYLPLSTKKCLLVIQPITRGANIGQTLKNQTIFYITYLDGLKTGTVKTLY
jgi:hypothetical protein